MIDHLCNKVLDYGGTQDMRSAFLRVGFAACHKAEIEKCHIDYSNNAIDFFFEVIIIERNTFTNKSEKGTKCLDMMFLFLIAAEVNIKKSHREIIFFFCL